MITAVRIPLLGGNTGVGFAEQRRTQASFALAAAVATINVEDGVVTDARIGLAGVSDVYYGGFSREVDTILAAAAWGWHIEAGLHLLRLILAGTFDRLPTLQVVVGHLREGLPFMLQRADERLPREVTGLERPVSSRYLCENVHLTISGFFYLAPFLNALHEFGADRILFSVDYPFSSNEEGRAFLDRIPVSPQDREKIAHGNAERLFGL